MPKRQIILGFLLCLTYISHGVACLSFLQRARRDRKVLAQTFEDFGHFAIGMMVVRYVLIRVTKRQTTGLTALRRIEADERPRQRAPEAKARCSMHDAREGKITYPLHSIDDFPALVVSANSGSGRISSRNHYSDLYSDISTRLTIIHPCETHRHRPIYIQV